MLRQRQFQRQEETRTVWKVGLLEVVCNEDGSVSETWEPRASRAWKWAKLPISQGPSGFPHESVKHRGWRWACRLFDCEQKGEDFSKHTFHSNDSFALQDNIYKIGFRKVLEEHELSVWVDPSGNVGFVLPSLLYNLRNDHIDDHAECDVNGLNDMKDSVKVLGYIIEARVY